jgi:hypothetical protein
MQAKGMQTKRGQGKGDASEWIASRVMQAKCKTKRDTSKGDASQGGC